jgi:hypothetical protein
MYALAAQESLIGAVQQAIQDAKIDDATIRTPFLGKAIIECSQETSISMLQSKVAGLRPF